MIHLEANFYLKFATKLFQSKLLSNVKFESGEFNSPKTTMLFSTTYDYNLICEITSFNELALYLNFSTSSSVRRIGIFP